MLRRKKAGDGAEPALSGTTLRSSAVPPSSGAVRWGGVVIVGGLLLWVALVFFRSGWLALESVRDGCPSPESFPKEFYVRGDNNGRL